MKKLLNISLVLLVFCSSGSLSCKGLFKSKKAAPVAAAPGLSAGDFFQTETRKAMAMSKPRPVPTASIIPPRAVPSELVDVSSPGSFAVPTPGDADAV